MVIPTVQFFSVTINHFLKTHHSPDSCLRCLQWPKLCGGVFSACAVKISGACLPERERLSASPQGALFSCKHTPTHTHTYVHTRTEFGASRHSSTHSSSGSGRLPPPSPTTGLQSSPLLFSSLHPPPLHHPPPQTTSILGFGKVEKQSDG